MRRTLIAISGLLLLVPFVSAGGGPEEDPVTGVDAEIREDVEEALVRDGRVDADEVEVTVEGGIVRLVGSVDSVREQNAAVADARGVLGVLDVVNDLQVEIDAIATGDQLLELEVRRALVSDPNVDASDLVVRADGTLVALSGSVDSLYEREVAVSTAADVVGVVTVVNDLIVDPVSRRTDEEIRSDIQDALIRNSIVDRDDIVVLVQGGQVTLTGTVSSWIEEQEALDVAQFTAGVTSVVDQLQIEGTVFDDATTGTIRRQVREQLRWDVRVDASDLTVFVEDGVVTLSGTVRSAAAESAALASAWSVAGVRNVIDRLSVVTVARPSETSLARIVENSLQLDPDVVVEGLEVTEEDGVVSIFGSVDEAWMKREADTIAGNTIGVRAVENNLLVVPPDARTDVEIRLDIISSLQTDPRVDASDVEVTVDDGEVTYDGTVSSWDAWETTYAIALRTEGVVEVDSELTVEQ